MRRFTDAAAPDGKRARALRAAALAVALLAAGSAHAALYKWVDANGRTVYSDQPPSGNVKSEVVRGAAPPANPNAVKEMATKDAEFRKRQLDRADDAKKGEKARGDAARTQEFCTQARSQIKGLQSDTPYYRLNDKGERVLLDDAARRSEIERLEQLAREQNCPA